MFRIILLSLALLYTSRAAAQSSSGEFTPEKYQLADGAVVLDTNAVDVEPYFATKALIVAQDAGLDIRDAGVAWIQWLMPRQKSDGRFERYCRKGGEEFHACRAADADDSLLALWLQLLYRLAPDSGIPAEWQQSVSKAAKQLSKLRNGRLGIYHVSTRNHVALFMDNVEVYSALKDIAQAQARFGDSKAANSTRAAADKLASAIKHVFWDDHNHWFRPSMQKGRPGFYPDVVAQIFPWLEDMPVSDQDPQAAWKDWRSRFAAAWIQTKYDPHPWGLVALAALKMGDDNTALCWLSHSHHLRYSSRWNILEEAVMQGLEHRLQTEPVADRGASTPSRATPARVGNPGSCTQVIGQP